MLEFKVSPDAAGQRLDKFVRRVLKDVPLSHVYKMLRTRKVRVNGARGHAEQVLGEGDVVAIRGDEEKLAGAASPAAAPKGERRARGPAFGVLYEDEHLLAVDKPAGLPVHPTARYSAHTFTTLARARFPDRKVDPAHRIDRETSGVLACGCAPEHTGALKRSFARGEAHKTYLALVEGAPEGDAFAVDAPLALNHASTVRVRMHVDPSGLPSRTRFEVIGRRREPGGAPISLVACYPETGRQHQIRAHLLHAGLPMVGDKIYGPDEAIFDRFTRREMTDADRVRLRLARHALHAWRLELPHPVTREKVRLEAPLPEDIRMLWDACR